MHGYRQVIRLKPGRKLNIVRNMDHSGLYRSNNVLGFVWRQLIRYLIPYYHISIGARILTVFQRGVSAMLHQDKKVAIAMNRNPPSITPVIIMPHNNARSTLSLRRIPRNSLMLCMRGCGSDIETAFIPALPETSPSPVCLSTAPWWLFMIPMFLQKMFFTFVLLSYLLYIIIPGFLIFRHIWVLITLLKRDSS